MHGVNRNKCKYTHSPSFTMTVSSLRGRARLINLSLAKCPPSKDDGRICPQAYVIFVSEHFQYFNQNFCSLLNLIMSNEQNHCKNDKYVDKETCIHFIFGKTIMKKPFHVYSHLHFNLNSFYFSTLISLVGSRRADGSIWLFVIGN